MGTKLSKEFYVKIIKDDMEKVEKYFPKDSLQKIHIQSVLKNSIGYYYPCEGNPDKNEPTAGNCNIPYVIKSVCPACKKEGYKPNTFCCPYCGYTTVKQTVL